MQFKADCILSVAIRLRIFSQIGYCEIIPDEWATALMVKVPKKRDNQHCLNWKWNYTAIYDQQNEQTSIIRYVMNKIDLDNLDPVQTKLMHLELSRNSRQNGSRQCICYS